MLSVFMLSLFIISAFALENVSTVLDGHFPDYASYWYNSFDDKTEFDLLVLVNTSGKSQTGITIGVNYFGSQTAVYYRVYNADTGMLTTFYGLSKIGQFAYWKNYLYLSKINIERWSKYGTRKRIY